MLARLGHYFAALAVLLCSAGFYQITIARLLEPEVVEAVVLPDPKPLQADESLSSLFAPSAWQNGPCKQIQTANGVLLFEEWEQIDKDQWELKPVTIVVGRGLTPSDDPPIIMESTEGAVIRFGQSLDMMHSGTPTIKYAHLRGDVSIKQDRPETEKHRQRALVPPYLSRRPMSKLTIAAFGRQIRFWRTLAKRP